METYTRYLVHILNIGLNLIICIHPILEPAFLEKVARQKEEEEKEEEENVAKAITEVIIGADGEEQVITTTRRASMVPSERSYRYDIMISYCHADKELTYRIHKFLISQGFKVWIDLDNMYGPGKIIIVIC
jgi:hypothetical protein